MKLIWLEDFVILAKEQNFSRAAKLRNVAQPAFSRRIRALEDWAGADLFVRESHPIALTDQGEVLLPFAEEAIKAIARGKREVKESVAGVNVLKFASTHTVSIQFFPSWFSNIEGISDRMGISLQANHMNTCASSLIDGECHFLLCLNGPDADLGFNEDEYESKIIGRDVLIPVAAKNEELAPCYQLSEPSDHPIPILVYSEPSALGQLVDALLNRMDVMDNIIRRSESPAAENLLSLANSRHGIAWIVGMRLNNGQAARDLVQAGGDEWVIPVDIQIFKSHGPLPKIAEQFWERIPEIE